MKVMRYCLVLAMFYSAFSYAGPILTPGAKLVVGENPDADFTIVSDNEAKTQAAPTPLPHKTTSSGGSSRQDAATPASRSKVPGSGLSFHKRPSKKIKFAQDNARARAHLLHRHKIKKLAVNKRKCKAKVARG